MQNTSSTNAVKLLDLANYLDRHSLKITSSATWWKGSELTVLVSTEYDPTRREGHAWKQREGR